MEMRLALVSHLVLFVLGPLDALSPALSPSPSSLSHNSSNSSVIPTSSHFNQSTPTASHTSSHFSQSTPTASSPRCRQLKVSVCWLNSPPYLFKDNDTGKISGTFNETIELLLNKCKNDCNCENSSSKLNYTHQVRTASELTECMKMKSGFDLVFPVLNSHVINQRFYKRRFQEIISSPGIAVLRNRDVLAEKAKWNVIKEFSQVWTVVVLALLLNAIFGILIWVLVSRHVLLYVNEISNF